MRRSALIGALLAATLPWATLVAPSLSSKAFIERAISPMPSAERKRSSGKWSGHCRRSSNAPGWSVPEGKRRATKRRNQLRHKARARG